MNEKIIYELSDFIHFNLFQLAKPPPLSRPITPPRGGTGQSPRPFPVITPQSYLPGATGFGPLAGVAPTGRVNFPQLTPASFLTGTGPGEAPVINVGPRPGIAPPSTLLPQVPPLVLPGQASLPPAIINPKQEISSVATPRPLSLPYCDPGLRPYPCRRPVHICRRRRSRRRHPVIHIVESSSCSTLSSCTTISSCSRHRHRSHSRSRRCAPAPQQQPIILLPMQCQQSQPTITEDVRNLTRQEPRQVILPPIQIQSLEQCQQQQQLTSPSIPIQQQLLPLPPIQFTPSNLASSTNSSQIVIPSGQPIMKPSISLPQITAVAQPQQIRVAPVQYVQATTQSSSPLQYVSSEPRSTTALPRVLVNGTNEKQSAIAKPSSRSTSVRKIPQSDLKFGRRPFDWYNKDKKKHILINEKVQLDQRAGL